MEFSLHINGKYITNQNLSDHSGKCAVWEEDIYSFLKEWASNDDFVQVTTSGSTGTPKVIKLLKSDMIASARITSEYFSLQKGQTALLCLPAKYIAGKMMLVRAIMHNLRLQSVQPSSFPMAEINEHIHFAAMTPMQVKTILATDKSKFALIDTLIIGGAPVDHILEKDLQEIKTACYSTFGMTETVTHIAVKKLNGCRKTEHFTALDNVSFTTGADENLIIKAPHLQIPDVITNDNVSLIDSKTFTWNGRNDNIINSGGIKLHPETIEFKLRNILPEHRYFISAVPCDLLGEKIILVIESETPVLMIETKFKNFLNAIETPKKVLYTPRFVETETGKINRLQSLKQIK